MTTISQPNVSINIIPAQLEIGNEEQKVLFVGQMLAGTAEAGTLTESIGNQGEEDALFGAKSHIAAMIRAARKINQVTRFDAIALEDDAGGTAATGAVVFSGTATATGKFLVSLGSDKNSKYEISVAVGDTASQLADKLVAEIGEDANSIVSGVNTAGSVALTFSHKGEIGNQLTLRVEGTAAGITPTVTAMAGGADNPTTTGIFSVVGEDRYQTVVWPEAYDIDDVTVDFLDPRFNVNNDVQDGAAVRVGTDTLANLKTSGNSLNSRSLVYFGDKIVNEDRWKGGTIVELNDVQASQFAAIRSLRLTDGANISQYVISTSGALDSFGGTALASFPYFNTPIFDLPRIPAGKGFTKTEIEELFDAGISVMGNNTAGNGTIIGEVLTTEKTDNAGNPNATFKFLNNVDTSSNIREYYFRNLKARFAQSRLTEGDVISGRSMANRQTIEAYVDGLYRNLSGQDFVLVQAGDAAFKYFKANRKVQIDLVNGKVTLQMQMPIVVQMREVVATMQISFSTED